MTVQASSAQPALITPNYYLHVIVLILLSLRLVSSSEEVLNRQKRFLLYFPNGGSFKIVFGFAVPVKLGLRQTMAAGWNFQFQYPLAQSTNNTMGGWPPIVGRRKRELDPQDGWDGWRIPYKMSDRALAYRGIEAMLDSNGMNGRACLLRSICENAMETTYHEANGLYGQLLHIALTPDFGDGRTEPDLDPIYLEAKKAGEYGVDCTTLYSDCQFGHGLLDMISLLDEVHLNTTAH